MSEALWGKIAETFWSQEGGDTYTARNRVSWRDRVPFWRDVLEQTGARSVYEVGCNSGWNLSAIHRARPDVKCYGHDINQLAVLQARRAGHQVECGNKAFSYCRAEFDLAFTAGVLIHVPPEQLPTMMESIARVSADYVLAVEYADEVEVEVEYRGQAGLLWRRPYGKLYEAMGLQLVKEWDAGAGFDRCQAWLLRKPT